MKKLLSIIFTICCLTASSQMEFSLATDLSILRNLNKGQKFWTIGQTVKGNFHFSEKVAGYAWLSYYGKGFFGFDQSASAKSILTSPQQVDYSVRSSVRYKQVSVGLKRYLKGSYTAEQGVNLYGYAGFGLLFGTVENTFSQPVDTGFYMLQPPYAGEGKFNRLTFDLGAGVEYALAADIYVYTELRTWLPSSGYPSDYLRNNNNVPSVAALNIGARFLFR